MRSILSLLVRVITSPWTRFAVLAVVAFHPALAHAANISTDLSSPDAGPIANGTNDFNNGVVIPGASAVTGTSLAVASVAYSMDAQKQNIIRNAVGGALGGVTGVGCAVGVPPIMLKLAGSAQGALIPLHHAMIHLVAHLH